MIRPKPARIFISYASSDGAEAAAELRSALESYGFSIWQDVVALDGSADWWSQIENALRSKELHHFILVVTPSALANPVVRREIRLARQEGKTVSPIRGPGIDSMSKLPRWLGTLYDLSVDERRRNFLRVLELPSSATRVPVMAPQPPADFVTRDTEFNALKKLLLDSKGDAVAITAAFRGVGGYGKSTLAKALAHDPDIQDAYFDGVLWVELGEQGDERTKPLLSDIVALVTGNSCALITIDALRAAFADALGDRRILLVIDDVWRKHHLEPFLHGGKFTTRLITTRFDRELPEPAVRQVVNAMKVSEALQLISWGLPVLDAAQASSLIALAKRIGNWPQLLKLANRFLCERTSKGEPLEKAIAGLVVRYQTRGLDALGSTVTDYRDRHKSVAAVLETTLDLLDKEKRARFDELAIFPEDIDIPISVVAQLWRTTAHFDELVTEDLLHELASLSLLEALDLKRRTVRLHDNIRRYLQEAAKQRGTFAPLHHRFVQAMEGIGRSPKTSAAAPDYIYRYLPQHVAEAGERRELDALLLNPAWLKAKLAVTSSPLSLVLDYERYGHTKVQNLIGHTLHVTADVYERHHNQMLPQIMSRLLACVEPEALSFLQNAQRFLEPPYLCLQRPSLGSTSMGCALIEGHTSLVQALAELPDGRLASASFDGTIRLWDIVTGMQSATIRSPINWAGALAALPDGRLAAASQDNAIRLWDVVMCSETHCIQGHSGWVNAFTVLPDGRLASASNDKTIRLWDISTGAETARLEGHTSRVTSLAVLADGRLASGSWDHTIRLWDVDAGAQDAQLNGHTDWISALAILPDGRLTSGSHDGSIRIWDVGRHSEIARLQREGDWVKALAVLSNGRLVSGSWDGTIWVWDPINKNKICGLKVGGNVKCVAALSDGRVVGGDSIGPLHWLKIMD